LPICHGPIVALQEKSEEREEGTRGERQRKERAKKRTVRGNTNNIEVVVKFNNSITTIEANVNVLIRCI
jgi:hypothetical protein